MSYRRRVYFLSYIEWKGDYATGRGYDASQSFEAKTDDEARAEADRRMKGIKTSGPVYLRCVETRVVPYTTPRS